MSDPVLEIIVEMKDHFSTQFKSLENKIDQGGKSLQKSFDLVGASVGKLKNLVLGAFSIMAVKGMMDMAIKTESLESAFKNLNKSIGLDWGKSLSSFKRGLKDAASDMDIYASANKALLMGTV